MRADHGEVLPLNPHRWHADPDHREQQLLAALTPPVLDVGCGPGRVVAALATLIAPAGRIVAEVEPPGKGWRTGRVRLEHDGERSPWFTWAVVGADAIAEVAGAAGLEVLRVERSGARWFAHLVRADAAA
jgi:SAM-dependent methyltransferase